MLAVIDGAKPAMLRRAVEDGDAPFLAAVIERGALVDRLCAAFPSVTPVCATSIATGVLQDRHHIPGMNWWSRAEGRYVEYGSSLAAARKFGVTRQLIDTVYRMNGEHLARDVPTIFESLDDIGVRTAGTTYLIYRGRHEHQVNRSTALARIAGTLFRAPVRGPRELFYADIFASRDTGHRAQLGRPGLRDRHSGGVAAWLTARDMYDFLLLSLPDNDTHSHRYGPAAQVDSIAAADEQLQQVAEAAGGIDAFLDRHAVIVCADHSHTAVERRIDLFAAFDGWPVAGSNGGDGAEIALCPNQRAAQVYVLHPGARAGMMRGILATLDALPGVDVVCFAASGWAVARSPVRGEVRFRRGGRLRDGRGNAWTVEGDLGALGLQTSGGEIQSDSHPDALRRIWAALSCPTSGDVLVSAALGYEFADWGGVDHVGAGSHGSLHADDSLGALVFCGCEPPPVARSGAWSITDVAAMVRAHFGL